MKKVTKRALSLAVTTLLLMNTFSITAFANNGHGYGHENNKDWFENGHDNRDHAKQHEQELEQNDEQEQPEIEILIDELEEEELQEEEIQQEESEEEEIPAEEAQEEAAEEEIQQEESEEEETPAEEAQEEAFEEIVEEFEQIEAVEEEAEEEVEEAEAEAEPEEEPWRSYTLYNYISVNNGKTYISLNTQEDGITTPKTAAEFHRENNNKKYNLEGYEYEIEDYDLTELVYTENGISYVEKSVAAKGQPYFTARLDRVEAVAQARFRASNCVEGIESFTSIEDGTITFHRNWYLTLVRPMEADQKLLTGIQMPNGKYYGIDYTDTFKAIDSRTIAFSTKLNKDQYDIEDYDFTGLTLNYEGNTYEYRPDGPVAGDGNGFHYYTVKFQKLDKLAKSTYGGGYLKEGWPAWPLLNAKAADPDGFPYAAGYYHRDYTVTLHIGDAPAAVIEEEPVEEETIIEEKVEEQIVEEKVEEQIVEEKVEEQIVEEKVEEQIVEEKVEEQIVEEKIEEQIVEEKVEEEIAEEEIKKIIPAVVEEIIAIAAAAPVAEEIVEEAPAQIEEIVEEEAPAQIEEIVEEEAPAQFEEIVEEEAPAQIEEIVEEAQAVEEEPEQIEEIAPVIVASAPVRQNKKHTAANEATTHQPEQIVEEAVEDTEFIENAATPMAAITAEAIEEIEAVEEEIAEEAAPMAAFEAVTVAQNEPAQAAVAETLAEEPTFVAVASMQVADFVEIEETAVPMAAAGTWSLASLIFMGMSVILGIATLATATASRKAKFLATAIAAASAAIFLAFTTIGGAMVTADGGTIGIIALNICEAVLASVATNTAK